MELKPDQIMYFGNIYTYGSGFDKSTVARLHNDGFVTVMVGTPYRYTGAEARVDDIMKREVDVVLPGISSIDNIIEIVERYINLPEPEDSMEIDTVERNKIYEAIASQA